MVTTPASVKCGKCGQRFGADGRSFRAWTCTHCGNKHPNLRRHYAAIASYLICGLAVSGFTAAIGLLRLGPLGWSHVLVAAMVCLVLTTIAVILRSRSPWADTTTKVLVWVVFGLAFLVNVVKPFGGIDNRRGAYSGGFPTVIYGILLAYLFWLNDKAETLCGTDGSATPEAGRLDEDVSGL